MTRMPLDLARLLVTQRDTETREKAVVPRPRPAPGQHKAPVRAKVKVPRQRRGDELPPG